MAGRCDCVKYYLIVIVFVLNWCVPVAVGLVLTIVCLQIEIYSLWRFRFSSLIDFTYILNTKVRLAVLRRHLLHIRLLCVL